jgi:glycosyltransferase involved in cell wall biosynthesis
MLSIITPVLNGENFIESNIKEIQKLKINFEHIIVDGGSSDRTLAILNKYPHVKLVIQSNNFGMYGAIHEGILSSNGDYVAYVNCDDLILKNGFEKMYNDIIKNRCDLIYSDGYWHYPKKNKYIIKPGIPFGSFFLKNGILPFIQPSSIYLKSSYNKINGFDYKKFKIIGDKDLFVRMSKIKGFNAKYINTFSTIFLKYGDSLGDRNISLYQKELIFCPRNKSLVVSFCYHFLRIINTIQIKLFCKNL